MPIDLKAPPPANGNEKRLNNYRIFRPPAIEAWTTRQAGDPWAARVRLETWLIAGLTVIAAVAAALVFRGGY